MSGSPADSYDGEFERTAEGGVIRFERQLRYPVREVWDAITNPARLADWWLPFEADITIDLRAGGQMVIAPRGGDELATITCTILRVEPPLLLEHTHLDGTSYMRWELESVDTGCVLRLSHFVTDIAGAIDKSYIAGLHTSLERLAPCLAGRPVPWDWDVFAEARAHYANVGLAPPDNDA
jgi:uncharacterized protein YndB with AHSA1/START domain